MSTVTLYHNPNCSKSRGALALLEERGVEPEIVAYLHTPQSREALLQLIETIGGDPSEIVRTGDKAYEDVGAKLSAAPDAGEVATLLAAHPALMQRPIVKVGDRALVARPPEKLLELL